MDIPNSSSQPGNGGINHLPSIFGGQTVAAADSPPKTPDDKVSDDRLQSDDEDPFAALNFNEPVIYDPENEFFARYANETSAERKQTNIRELGIFLNSRKRAAAQKQNIGLSGAWLDQDESGDYDPNERRTPRAPPRAAKPKRSRPVELDDDESPKRNKIIAGRGFYLSDIHTFKFENETGREYLRSIPAGPFRDQEEHEVSEADEDSDDDLRTPKRRKTRRHTKKPGAGKKIRADGLTIDQLTIGHPQRRGCKACFESGNDRCSLIDHSDEYPCIECEDAGFDCEFIVPPKLKKSCERCKVRRRPCSYKKDGGRGQDTCEECEDEGVSCFAAPLKDSNYSRRYDEVLARPPAERKFVDPAPTIRSRRYVACNQCRDGKLRCSNKGKTDQGPCRECKKKGEECKFVLQLTPGPKLLQENDPLAHPKPRGRKKGSGLLEPGTTTGRRLGDSGTLSQRTTTEMLLKELEETESKALLRKNKKTPLSSYSSHDSHAISSASPSFDTIPRLIGTTAGYSHIHITTSYCHPISFNYIPDPLQKSPCSWCENSFFGLCGLADESGPRVVEGFYWNDGSGFEELFGGFSEMGYERSRMCVICTTLRLQIMTCTQHVLRSLKEKEIDWRVFDDEEWNRSEEAIKNGNTEEGKLILEAKWCSLCPNLATFTCCTKGDSDLSTLTQTGCGLLLCRECHTLCEKIHKGGLWRGDEVLDTMVREIKQNKWLFPSGVRADAQFLTSTGELWVRMEQGIGAGKESGAGRTPKKVCEKRKGAVGGGVKKENKVKESEMKENQHKSGKEKRLAEMGAEFGGPLTKKAREEQNRRVAMAFGGEVIDLTDD